MNTKLLNAAIPEAASSTEETIGIESDDAWRQVLARDPAAEFFYAVSTTGIFCRPACSSRRPLRANTRFFPSASAALAAGFRPCRVCRPTAPHRDPLHRLREHIERNVDQPVRLADLAGIVKLSPFTVQRLFKRRMGASPLAYQRALRAGTFRAALRNGSAVTDAVYAAGFGSPSGAYETASLGMTPAQFARGGKGERIGYCSAPSPFGRIIAGATERGLCWLSLAATKDEAEAALRAEFPAAKLRRDPALQRHLKTAMDSIREGSQTAHSAAPEQLDLRGTVFQLRVWEALRRIPRGETRTYSQLAREMGVPKSTRAVARACATNRVALLVPCHRVIGASGSLTGYRWGVERKRQILDAERA
ncbi:MAG TPA: methylated-DNA--[protein]-cysteine S-methyltransferase [Bryobacteraceae bacterium]|nr:methylated-DNA--[protein]-cysteine S-methyltransferase [Bryobacteraceae bacterium]